jgi:hypothetical protein
MSETRIDGLGGSWLSRTTISSAYKKIPGRVDRSPSRSSCW